MDITGKKILVAESEPSSSQAEAEILRAHGCEAVAVTKMENLEEFLGTDSGYSLLLAELNPGPDPCQAERLNQLFSIQGLPIVFLGESADRQIVEKLRKTPWYGFVQKGSGDQALLSAIDAALELFGLREENRILRTALQESEEKYKATFQTSPDSITISDQDGRYIEINDGFTALTGYKREEVLGLKASEVGLWVNPEDRDRLLKSVFQDGVCSDFESLFRCKNGGIKTGLLSARLITYNKKTFLIIVVRDITERKKTEERTQELLEEKELLLREVHHRVKNNMASIASLLSLQANSAKSEDVSVALREMGSRIRSIQIVYEKLFHSTDFKNISLGEYLGDMMEIIRSSLPRESSITLDSRLSDVPLEANRIFPLGLIANELVTNALKHAFPDGRAGTVHVSLDRIQPNSCMLTVSDNGQGLPENLDPENSTGFGLTLISALTAQLGGSLSFKRGRGTEASVVFPLPEEARAAALASENLP